MESEGKSEQDSESGQPVKTRPTLTERFLQEVDLRFTYLPLLVCCFITGLTDGTIYNAYGTFVSMQTGNTIFIALGTSGYNNKPYGWARSLCSIAFFIIGSFAFSRIYKYLGGQRRGVLTGSFLFQFLCVVVAASIVEGGIIEGSYPSTQPASYVDFKELILIALLSFQAAGQIVSSRALNVGEVPTVVITSLLCDLMSDPALISTNRNDKRDRRFVAFVLTLAGAICGGWISKASGAVQPSFWTVAGLKLAISAAWIFWKPKKQPPAA